MMRVLNNLLMAMVGVVVLWSLIGISMTQVGGETHYSFFIKSEPTLQILHK